MMYFVTSSCNEPCHQKLAVKKQNFYILGQTWCINFLQNQINFLLPSLHQIKLSFSIPAVTIAQMHVLLAIKLITKKGPKGLMRFN